MDKIKNFFSDQAKESRKYIAVFKGSYYNIYKEPT